MKDIECSTVIILKKILKLSTPNLIVKPLFGDPGFEQTQSQTHVETRTKNLKILREQKFNDRASEKLYHHQINAQNPGVTKLLL